MSGTTSLINRDVAVVSGSGTNTVSLTVPAGQNWLVYSVGGIFDTDTGIGSRVLVLEALSAGDVLLERIGAMADAQPVDETNHYRFVAVGARDAAPVSGHVVGPGPPFCLVAGEKLRVRDLADIDSTNDALTVRASIDRDYGAA